MVLVVSVTSLINGNWLEPGVVQNGNGSVNYAVGLGDWKLENQTDEHPGHYFSPHPELNQLPSCFLEAGPDSGLVVFEMAVPTVATGVPVCCLVRGTCKEVGLGTWEEDICAPLADSALSLVGGFVQIILQV